MKCPNGKDIGDATSSKQAIDYNTEALVVASDTLDGTAGLDYNHRNIYYNVIDPRAQKKRFSDGSRATTGTSTLAEATPVEVIPSYQALLSILRHHRTLRVPPDPD